MHIRFIFILFLLLYPALNVLAGNTTDRAPIGVAIDSTHTMPDTFIATFENPINPNSAANNTITLNGNHNLMMCDADNGRDRQSVYLSPDSLRGSGKTIGRLLLDNPGKIVVNEVNPYSAETMDLRRQSDEFEERHKQEIGAIYDNWIERERSQFQRLSGELTGNPALSPNNVQMPASKIDFGLILAGGSGSLDRPTIISFIFVEGNGPANFDWTEERLNYCIDQSNLAMTEIVAAAKSFGIRLRLRMTYGLAPIGYEPVMEPAGLDYYASFDVNGLDPWRSAAIGALGFSPNLQGLYDYNLRRKGDWGMADGAICFVVNFDTLLAHPTGVYADWANTWIDSLLICKPYCTVSFNTIDSVIMHQKMKHECFHLFGAADEYFDATGCQSSADCSAPVYGKLLVRNGNCVFCFAPGIQPDSCIMRGSTAHKVCAYTAHQLGWLDSDGNGGSNVDDMPVDYSGFATGFFHTGDILRFWTADRDFVNAFVISDYNSWRQPNGSRTVQVLGLNYARMKISPSIYIGRVNNGSEFSLVINCSGNHAALQITDLSSYGPYIEFKATGAGHVNMEITDNTTHKVYTLFSGDMIAGSNTTYRTLVDDDLWLKDGLYNHWSQNWACDGVSGQLAGSHLVNYGPPGKADLMSLFFNQATDSGNASWVLGDWTNNAYLYENSRKLADITDDLSTASWFNHIGSDYCHVYVLAWNPNGASYSDTLAYLTPPNPPRNIQFSQVYQTVCQPAIRNVEPIVPDPKNPTPCELFTRQINAIALSCLQPDLQRVENITGYLMRLGHYIEYPPGSFNYIWKKDSLYIPGSEGYTLDTMYNLNPFARYWGNVVTFDRFGGISEWGLPVYDSFLVGDLPLHVQDPPTQPSNDASKQSDIPLQFAVSQNYPNPFNPLTTIKFALPVASSWALRIFNLSGATVKEIKGYDDAGCRQLTLDMSEFPSGVYFYKFGAGQYTATHKMVLLK